MDSLAANYASSDEDADGEGSYEQLGAEAAAERNPSVASNPVDSSGPLQLPPPKPSPLFSSSLPPPKTSSSASLLSSLPPPKSLSSNPPPLLPSLSEQGSRRAGEEDGAKGQKGGIFSKGALPKPLSANPSTGHRADLGSNRIGEVEEEEEEDQEDGVLTKVAPSSATFKAQNAIFSALPQPKTSSSSSLLSSLPPPRTTASNPQRTASFPSSAQNSKKVVQFKLPIDPSLFKRSNLDDEDDDDDEEEKERDRSQDASSTASKSFSSLIPAPKQTTLGTAPLGGGSSTSRRSIIEADVPAESYGHLDSEQEVGHSANYGSYDGGLVGALPPEAGAEGVADLGYFATSSTDYSWNPTGAGGESWGPAGAEVASYPGHAGNADGSGWDPSHVAAADYESYGSYGGNWYDTSGAVEAASQVPDMGRITGKRGRNEIPVEIVEVKQDELMKNRPRQDTSKLTGMAFGPSYQPASSTKEKPTKLHKRKHQIGSLYFDMKQKETELAERRARGLLTKTQTQGKYGW